MAKVFHNVGSKKMRAVVAIIRALTFRANNRRRRRHCFLEHPPFYPNLETRKYLII